ncbi:PTS mannose family transporter subunit IIA [Bombilactobacillus bombi]|uniref:phosphoenolpyruvate--glycerone phosphotransferase n=1 Tax=Bombilactobacillus bombi TaxID=1303590 RepID=A0A347SRE5_9LACO|nr:dihydroxyacetone kinase phosphoryl donor subunit DhaM [Bombilactobacillus bombi]AXX64604.1 PTS-dependent dihydroxyacetone kinase phosphotransferase subunit DhaM [Bombilactobacillus bombi]RHW46925.1 PTS mannose family transporter subunit IIA [Bombilactobacillus bombi]RHW49925.1 PTS mannose family transporter subunit IIA [Bombilactobacillus bombi]
MKYGILVVSHVPEIAQGVAKLALQAAPDVSITFAGGTDEGQIGSSLNMIQKAISDNQGDEILAFYDLGSAKMNLEMAREMSTKPIHQFDVALVEGAYTAATLAQVNVDFTTIVSNLDKLHLEK